MNRYIVSAVALMASAGIAIAQSPKGQEASPPAAKSEAPGQTKPADGSTKPVAPGQTKEPGSSAADEAPGRAKTQDRVDDRVKGSGDEKSKSRSSQPDGRASDDKSTDRSDEGKSKSKGSKSSADDRERDGSGKADRNASGKDEKATGGPRGGDDARQTGEGRKRDGGSASINLKPEQKTKVITTFKSHRVAPVTNINISVGVGTVVPKTVELHPIPRDILVIAPAYEGYRYFVFEDRIIIVEPATYEIVDVLVIG